MNMNTRQTRSGRAAGSTPTPEKKAKEEPQPGPAPKVKTEKSGDTPNPPLPTLVRASADSSSSPTRELQIKDWTEFHVDQIKKFAAVFRDHIESIDKNFLKADERKLNRNNNGSYTVALGVVQQVHQAIKSHVELLQNFDTRMCEEFTEKHPRKEALNFSKIEPPASPSGEAEALFSGNIINTSEAETEIGDNLKKENEADRGGDGDETELPPTSTETQPAAPPVDPESDEDEAFCKRALLADSDDEETQGRKLRPRSSRNKPSSPMNEDGNRSEEEEERKKTRKSIRGRPSTSGAVSEYEDALENLDLDPVDQMNAIQEEAQVGDDASTKRNEEEPHSKGAEKTIKDKTLLECKVNVQRLGSTILNELERQGVVRLPEMDSDSSDGDDCDKLLAALRQKIETGPTPKSAKARGKRKTRNRNKENTERSGAELDSDDSEDEDLEAIRLRKEELPIRPKSLNELLSSHESGASDSEEAARKKLLESADSEDDDGEQKASKKESKRTDKGESSKPKPKTPYTGPDVRPPDSSSDGSDSKSKSKRSRRNKDETDDRKSRRNSGTDVASPSKTGRVLPSDSEVSEVSAEGTKKEKRSKDAGTSGTQKHKNGEEKSNRKSESSVVVVSGDSDSEDVPKKITRQAAKKGIKTKVKKDNDDESDSSENSDFVPTKKAKLLKNRKGSDSDADVQEISDSSGSESSGGHKRKGKKKKRASASSTDSDASTKKKNKKARRRIKTNSSSGEGEENSDDSDDPNASQGSGKGRKNIRKLIKVKDLKVTTKEAAKQEEARKQRLIERQKLYNEIFKPPESDKLESLVLDFNKDTKEALVSVDPGIVAQLKPHQSKGIQFMWNACFESLEKKKEGGCILAHCMGLGKTLQSVAFVHTLIQHKKTGVKTALIICPLNTVENWYTEFRKWTRNADGHTNLHRLWDEKGNNRYTCLQTWHKRGGAGILHYEGFRALINSDQKKGKQKVPSRFLQIIKETLIDPGPDLVICDEGHLLKNASSLISKAVNRIKTQRRIVLTGTPLQNNLNEYHTMMSFVKPSLLGDIKEFRNRFVNPILNGQHKDSQPNDVVLMKKRAHVLHKLLEGCVQRLDYTVLTPFLPPKFEYAITVNLTDKQMDLYDFYIKNLCSRAQGEGFATTKLFTDYTVLNKICTHPIVLTYLTRADLNRDSSRGSDSEGSLKDFICDDESTTPEEDSSSESDEDGNRVKKSKPVKKVKTRSAVKEAGEEPEILVLPEEGKSSSSAWYRQFFENDEEMRKIELSGKLRVLVEILRVAELVGDKILIFSQYLTTLDLIEEFLADLDAVAAEEYKKSNRDGDILNLSGSRSWEGRYRKQIDYFRIDGSTKTSNRQDQCEKFNQNFNKAKLFLISIRAGGLGINLHGANRVVIFDASWNPSQDLQAIFRVYRFGQNKPSYIYRLLARGTMEEKIYNRQVVKLSLSCRVVDEQQIERHYHYDDLQKMYHFDRDDPAERPIPAVPKDKLLAGLLQTHKDWVFSYLEHDSLLENKEEEELSEEAKKLAWEEFNTEGTRVSASVGLNLETFRYEFDSKPGYFGIATREWCVYTMHRLHQCHPTALLGSLVVTTRDIVDILQNLMEKYPYACGQIPSTPAVTMEAVQYFNSYADKLRKTYRETLCYRDLLFNGQLTGLSPEFVTALLPPNKLPYGANLNINQLATSFLSNQQRPRQAPTILRTQQQQRIGTRTPTPTSAFQNTASSIYNNGAGTSTVGQLTNFIRNALSGQQTARASINSVPRPYVPPQPPQVVELDE